MQSWWLNGRASPKLIEHIAECIQTTQQDNAKARKSHIKQRPGAVKLEMQQVRKLVLVKDRWVV